MSHELKTPLNQIINQQIELLNPCYALTEVSKNILKKSISMSQYLLSLVRDMIDYSYIKSNNLAITNSWFSITSLLNECITILKDFSGQSSIQMKLNP